MNYIVGNVKDEEDFSEELYKFFFNTDDVESFWGDNNETFILFTSGIVVKSEIDVEDFFHDYKLEKSKKEKYEKLYRICIN